ncbi:MAG: TonB-dependent receptor plug domain-containing protein [Acidobacteria bacterium]|nr:TonB-dependent receptor plug domain-containing protein [Acidobacteriota bacterium]
MPGFERAERDVELTARLVATVDVDLRLGGLFEEVTVSVTGTAIEAPAIDMPLAVTVVSRETLEQQGSTQLVDRFRNLNVSHGVVGERDSWYNSNQPATLTETVANVNLRGLGASRTLVLINGRRHVPVPARLIGGRFVDVNTIPSIAVGRLEVLKEGASATYGSDAVGGVANFVTRNDFRGFELNVAHDHFDRAGDTTIAGIWDGRIGASSAVFSAERVGRRELRMDERPWTLDRLSTFPPGSRAGWSVLENPGVFSVDEPLPWDGDIMDPRCEDFGGLDSRWTCRFRYAPYDNLIEAQEHTRAFVEVNGPLNDRTNYHVEGLWSDAVIPNWYTTPSYGPVATSLPLSWRGRRIIRAGRRSARPTRAMPPSTRWAPAGVTPHGTSTAVRTGTRVPHARFVVNRAPGGLQHPSMAISRWAGGTPIGTSVSATRVRGATSGCPGSTGIGCFAPSAGSAAPPAGSGSLRTTAPGREWSSAPSTARRRARGLACTTTRSAMPISTPSSRARGSWTPPIPTTFPPWRTPRRCGGWLNEEVDLISTTDLLVADATLSGNLVENVADFAAGY